MARVQQIKRNDGTTIHTINIPSKVVEETQLTKGTELDIRAKNKNEIIMVKKVWTS